MLAEPHIVKQLTEKLQAGTVVHKKAKDILRAAQLSLLPMDNPHVTADLAKIKKGQPLSPILLIRGDCATGVPLQIADGYHRVCASYYTDENTDIPGRPRVVEPVTGAPAWGRLCSVLECPCD